MTRLRSAPLAAALLVVALAAAGAQAASITTTFAGGNGCYGSMFDVTSTVPIEIASFDQNVYSTIAQTVDVYYKVGTYVGSETNAGAWTLLGSAPITGVGDNLPTPVPIGGLVIPANTTYGLYIDLPNPAGGNNYTNGDNVYSNGTVTITTGAGLCDTFGSVIASRTWNGTIYYQAASSTALVSSLNPSNFGDSVTFTATVTGVAPTGNVEFYDGASLLGTVPLAAGSAAYTTAALTAGPHVITADYLGDVDNAPSNATLTQQVEERVSVLEIPTLGELGLLVLALGLGAAGVGRLRRRRA